MKKILVIVAFLLIAAFIASPVLAIGPELAFEEGNNPNLWFGGGAIHNMRGEAGGNILWFDYYDSAQVYKYSGKWIMADPTSGQGKMNNAIIGTIVTLSTYSTDQAAYISGNPTVNENKWIFLSPDGSGYQFAFSPPNPLSALGPHGSLWWLMYLGPARRDATVASSIVTNYPDGVFWTYNFVVVK